MVDGNYMPPSSLDEKNRLCGALAAIHAQRSADSNTDSALKLAKAHGDLVLSTYTMYYSTAIDQTTDTITEFGFEKLIKYYDNDPAIHSPVFDKLINLVRGQDPWSDMGMAHMFASLYVSLIADSVSGIVRHKTPQVLDAAFGYTSSFSGTFDIPGAGQRTVKFDGHYALAHPSTKSYYMAHAITISTDGGREPIYYETLEAEMAKRNIYGFRPALYRPSSVSACLVLFDLVAILHCDHLVMDLTNGLSIGATVEANFAYLCGKQIIVVGHEDEPISEFAKTLARKHSNVHRSIWKDKERIANEVCEKMCAHNGRWY